MQLVASFEGSTLRKMKPKGNVSELFLFFSPLIHQVALAGFLDEPPKIEQSYAHFSEFTNSTGLFKDHLFPHFHPSGAL
jgi:hypothetical protein